MACNTRIPRKLVNGRDHPESGQDDLKRLRGRANRLIREIDSLRTTAANQAAHAREIETRLRNELDGIKASRVWRTALLLRSIRYCLSPQGLRSFLKTGSCGGTVPETDGPDLRARRYEAFLAAHESTAAWRRHLRQSADALTRRPLVSIVMPVHDTEAAVLEEAVGSVRDQVYDHWELCIVDDASGRAETVRLLGSISHPRIRIKRLDGNLGIAGATNECIAMTRGEYVVFLDHDDRLAPDALFEVVSEINRSDADFIYSDEDCIDDSGRRTNPHFKPDFSPDLLLSHNYITHLVAARRDLLARIGGLRGELDGAQDYDLVLRATEQAERIRHIPRILYHWRMSETSTSMRPESKPRALEHGRQALNDALERRKQPGAAVVDPVAPHFYRVRYTIRNNPLVSILIPFREQAELLHCVVGDVLEKSTYENFEIVGINNGSTEPATADAIRDLSGLDERIRFTDYNRPFNFSGVMNHGVAASAGTHLVFLNNDIRILSGDWLEAMLEHSQRPEVGAVGGKLYYPDGRVQHAGIIIGIDGYAGHSHKGFPGTHQGYFHRLKVVQNVSAVTGAFMMVSRSAFESVGGFDDRNFAVACNDVDLCLRIRTLGLWNVFTPHAEACHIESASRGYEDTPDKLARYAGERAAFVERHADLLKSGDPFYNPNLATESGDFLVRVDGST